MNSKEIGATAYAAMWHFCGGKSLETGQAMATWQKLDPHIQDAWDAAGHAVLREHGTHETKQPKSETKQPKSETKTTQ